MVFLVQEKVIQIIQKDTSVQALQLHNTRNHKKKNNIDHMVPFIEVFHVRIV